MEDFIFKFRSVWLKAYSHFNYTILPPSGIEKFCILIESLKTKFLPKNISNGFKGSSEVELFGDKESLDTPQILLYK